MLSRMSRVLRPASLEALVSSGAAPRSGVIFANLAGRSALERSVSSGLSLARLLECGTPVMGIALLSRSGFSSQTGGGGAAGPMPKPTTTAAETQTSQVAPATAATTAAAAAPEVPGVPIWQREAAAAAAAAQGPRMSWEQKPTKPTAGAEEVRSMSEKGDIIDEFLQMKERQAAEARGEAVGPSKLALYSYEGGIRIFLPLRRAFAYVCTVMFGFRLYVALTVPDMDLIVPVAGLGMSLGVLYMMSRDAKWAVLRLAVEKNNPNSPLYITRNSPWGREYTEAFRKEDFPGLPLSTDLTRVAGQTTFPMKLKGMAGFFLLDRKGRFDFSGRLDQYLGYSVSSFARCPPSPLTEAQDEAQRAALKDAPEAKPIPPPAPKQDKDEEGEEDDGKGRQPAAQGKGKGKGKGPK